MRTALLTTLTILGIAGQAAAECSSFTVTSADQICPAAATSCVINQAFCIAAGATLDFGTRGLEFERRGQLSVQPGGVISIKAGKVNLMAAGGDCAIVGPGADIFVDATGDVTIGRTGTTFACIDLSGNPGGTIDIATTASINVQGVIDTHAAGDQFVGNGVILEAAQLTVDPKAEIDVSGSTDTDAGTVEVFAESRIKFAGMIHGKGIAGAEVSFTTDEGDIDTTGAHMDLQGSEGGGAGGSLNIDATGSVTLGGEVQLSGDAGADEEIGDAGTIDVLATGDILITANPIDLTGAPGGMAGAASFEADGNITQSTKINASGQGEGGEGEVDFLARQNLILGEIDVTHQSSSDFGGGVVAEAWCSLTLPAGRTIRANGPGGTTRLASGGPLTVNGTIRAGLSNTLEFRSAPPVVTGSVVPRTDVPNPSLTPCGGPPVCGNGSLEVDEPCDGAQGACLAAGDICKTDCSGCTTCGNTKLDAGETCDPTAADDGCAAGSACAQDCSACQQCGNGTRDTGEECDGQLGSCPAGATCNAVCNCTVRCGDGIKAASEACDDGNTNDCDGCNSTCSRVDDDCGDGIRECGEACDDGNTDPCVGKCAADCSRPSPLCGDGLKECDEEDDKGNDLSCDGDSVSALCKIERCGDGIPECNEQCDEGLGGSLTCTPQCTSIIPPRCGDGVVQPEDGEVCDDGNRDQCTGTCAGDCSRSANACGDRVVECNEQCDDGGTASGDGCSATCLLEVCGNGIVDFGELCDKGAANGRASSGCSVNCRPAQVCSIGSAGECNPCVDDQDCGDGRGVCGDGAVCSNGVCTTVTPLNCDDGNGCTTDSCDPVAGCAHAPVVCQDSTACDGALSCNPATGQCVNGPAPSCDDGDRCTDDSCTETPPTATCRNEQRPGLAGANCRLDLLKEVIGAASDIPKATRKKLQKQVKTIAKKLPAAAGTGKKAQKALKQIGNGLNALRRTVAKAQRKLSPDTTSKLNAAIQNTSTAVGGL